MSSEEEPKQKILIIEDEALVARELKSRLTSMGCEVVGIAYGREGIELARQTKPDLLLSDIHLKDGEDGIEMAKIIQAERDVPVVFLTAYSDEDTVSRAKEVTPYGYIIKPVENRELRIAIDMALYKFAIEKELRETQQLLQNALTCIGSALVFVDKSGFITNLNADAESILGRSRSEVLGLVWSDVIQLAGNSVQNKIGMALQSNEVVKLAPFIVTTNSKATLIDGIVGPMTDGGVLILRALTEINDQIEVLPTTDELLGQIGAERLAPIESSMCQLLIAADTPGKPMLLDETVRFLNQLLRSTDLVSVYAASQLSVSMPYTSVSEGRLIADSVLLALQDKFTEGTFSIGLAHSLAGDQQPFELFRQTNWALNVARDAGGNRVIMWEEAKERVAPSTTTDAEKQREYHNLVLLWNVLSVVSKSSDLDEVSEKLCRHLVQSFSLKMAAVLTNESGAMSVLRGVGDGGEVIKTVKVLNLSAGAFTTAKTIFNSDLDSGQHGAVYFFKLTAKKLLCIFSEVSLTPPEIDFLKTLMTYVAAGLTRFEMTEKEDFVDDDDDFIFQSSIMKNIEESIGLVAPTDATVLISGESGTGKEVIAKALHEASDRSHAPFVIVDCGAVAASLIESELFGHVKGAFTGADKRFAGRLVQADGGTLMLDEVGELPLDIQVKLLRFVQNREIAAVGSNAYFSVNTRVVAATNRDLKKLVEAGKFREDLYYRLNVFSIHSPPLREREGDILLIANFYLKKFCRQYQKNITGFSDEANRALEQYPWPGNIRELMNKVNRAVILCKDKQLSSIHLGVFPTGDRRKDSNRSQSLENWLAQLVDTNTEDGSFPPIGQWLEEDVMLSSLKLNNGVLNRAAQSLGIPESTLRRKVARMRELNGVAEPVRSTAWQADHDMMSEVISIAQNREVAVFDLISNTLISVIESRHFQRKDAASLMGVSLPTFRRLVGQSS